MDERSKQLLFEFSKLYPDPRSELNFRSDYELLVAVVLSAQCTDKKVNEVTPALFQKYPDFKNLAQADVTTVETIIRQVNYYKTKAKHLVALAKLVCSEFSGKVPDTHQELVTLPGVGQKTANVVLGERELAHTMPVDTHVFRVSKRLAIARGTTPAKVEESLKRRFPSETWRPLHHYLILHGRRICKAANPLCEKCAVLPLCPTGQRIMRKT